MIKDKRIIISLGFIAVLLIYLLLSNIKWKSGDIPSITGWESIDEIVISKQDKQQIKINNKDNKWLINKEYPADPDKVVKLEKDMKELEITDYISKGPHYIKYDLTPEKAIRVIVKKAGVVKRDVLIGKASSTNRSTYIKFADNDKVYLASGNLYDEYSKDLDEFRDKQIYKIERKDLEWIELNYETKLTFEKKVEEVEESPEKEAKVEAKDKKDKKEKTDKEKKKQKIEKWICREYKSMNIDTNKINILLDSFSSIKAESYSDLKKKDIKELACLIKAKVYDKEILLAIHKKDKENYLCTSSESPFVFVLREWEAKKFFKKLDDFKVDLPKEKKNK